MVLSEALNELRKTLRKGQQTMADWQGGELAVSAVPGAGKSTGMAVAAAIAIANFNLHRQKQLVIVTFTRSAVSNIRKKVSEHLKNLRLPQSAFTVSTLHSLAYTIASNHRDLSGFGAGETIIVSESQKQRLIRNATNLWVKENPKLYDLLLEGRSFDGEDTERLRRQTVLRTDVLPSLAREAIATAKSSELTPEDLRQAESSDGGTILEIAAGLYETYERLLRQEGAIDYDDMILGALRVLKNDSIRKYWQERVFAVFEDEAQDSSPLQTDLLEILALSPLEENIKNLMRVGDPNQAINSTFTTADPRFFNEFCDRCQLNSQLSTLDQAGRSTVNVMRAANYVLHWVNHSEYAKLEKPFRQQRIHPVDANDPQTNANPEPIGKGVEIYLPNTVDDIEHEIELIGLRIKQLHEQDPKLSMAILVRQHNQGRFVADSLAWLTKEYDIKIYDVEQSDRRSRVPIDMLAILQFIERPHSPDNLKSALEVLKDRLKISSQQDLNALASNPEQFLYPTLLDPTLTSLAQDAQSKCKALLRAKTELPLYNLIPFIAFTLYDDEAGLLATADKLGDRLNQQLVGNYSMQTVIAELKEIVESENFEAVEDENLEGRYMAAGQLTIISLHKAKGLDWDVVFLPFLHKRICPGEAYIPESAKFLGDFGLPEVARAQIRAIVHHERVPNAEEAWKQCSYLKQAEEFRLLYVGMTRAKKLLWLSAAQSAPFSWNTLENRTDNATVCPAITELAKKFPEFISW
ncbi:MAG: ATP-dependent helicase [Pseudanabaena sp.]|jgi:DNA helicase-2/ATP-dependent DNA helicase PcrA|uniref:ATP-dependent helicase n=1 Tax=Pseudanabaena mucicola TaxID=71190 RepID=UPI002577689B|nr:ATP-dependent helicase [Pseudanabaena mucicola]MCA6585267.1 ATP-dependent helicase [Pseudanabaena sp. M051S1SP1A06QC]MCA6597349.1 ATP-dependent helicase [Pseudanabaena sp. M046S1SP1A06QC]